MYKGVGAGSPLHYLAILSRKKYSEDVFEAFQKPVIHHNDDDDNNNNNNNLNKISND